MNPTNPVVSTSSSGSFYSQNFPGKMFYAKLTTTLVFEYLYHCLWTIKAPEGKSITAKITKNTASQACTNCSLTLIEGTGIFGGKRKKTYTFDQVRECKIR